MMCRRRYHWTKCPSATTPIPYSKQERMSTERSFRCFFVHMMTGVLRFTSIWLCLQYNYLGLRLLVSGYHQLYWVPSQCYLHTLLFKNYLSLLVLPLTSLILHPFFSLSLPGIFIS